MFLKRGPRPDLTIRRRFALFPTKVGTTKDGKDFYIWLRFYRIECEYLGSSIKYEDWRYKLLYRHPEIAIAEEYFITYADPAFY